MTIELPNLFIDAKTGYTVDTDALSYKVPIGKQYTKSEYAELLQMAETALKIGVAIGVWELVLFFLFKKVLFSMWILILTL